VPPKHYRRRRTVAAVLVEIRRDTYLTEPGGRPTAGINGLVEALRRLIDNLNTSG
jgi:N-formylglutamate deformylase